MLATTYGILRTLAVYLLVAAPQAAVAFTVNANGDQGLAATADPCRSCAAQGRVSFECTLRSAIEAANECPGEDTITIDPHVAASFKLGLDSGGHSDDINVRESLAINSDGARQITIDAGHGGRVFEVHAGTLRLYNIKIVNGMTSQEITTSDDDGGECAGAGGALCVHRDAMVVLENCSLETNQAANGGAIYGSMSLKGTTVAKNKADQRGGGLFVPSEATADVVNSVVSENSASTVACGIYSEGDLKVTGSTIRGNKTCDSGGGLAFVPSSPKTLIMSQSAVVENEAAQRGGGILLGPSSSGILENVTIAGNKAPNGAGVDVFGADATFRFVTIARNTASERGGGLLAEERGELSLKYSIVAENSPTNCEGTLRGLGNNIIEETRPTREIPDPPRKNQCTPAEGSIAPDSMAMEDLELGQLVTLPGKPPVIPLLPGSAALEKGDAQPPADCTSGAACGFDQVGTPRPQGRWTENDGQSPDLGANIDIGAYEKPAECPCRVFTDHMPHWRMHQGWKACVKRAVNALPRRQRRGTRQGIFAIAANAYCGPVKVTDDPDGDCIPPHLDGTCGTSVGADNCPRRFNPGQENSDDDQCGDVCDSNDDNDLYPDEQDRCPKEAFNNNYDRTDGDHVGDCCDECLGTPRGKAVDATGCAKDGSDTVDGPKTAGCGLLDPENDPRAKHVDNGCHGRRR